MDLNGKTDIDRALQAVGEILASEAQPYAIVVIGGAALNLLGIVERATTDVDILAFARLGADQPCELLRPPEPLPEPLLRAAHAVARDLGLERDWLNKGQPFSGTPDFLRGFPSGSTGANTPRLTFVSPTART